MKKDNKFATRSHLDERNWLINLGNGSLVEAVRLLIERAKEEQPYRRKTGRNKK